MLYFKGFKTKQSISVLWALLKHSVGGGDTDVTFEGLHYKTEYLHLFLLETITIIRHNKNGSDTNCYRFHKMHRQTG